MKFKQFIESLDSETEITVDDNNGHFWKASAMIDGRKIEFTAATHGGPDWWYIDFSDGGKFTLTGKGSEFKIMSMVKKCIELLIKAKHPKSIEFSAEKFEPSRVSLYGRMLKKFTPPNYTFAMNDKRDHTSYEMTLKD